MEDRYPFQVFDKNKIQFSFSNEIQIKINMNTFMTRVEPSTLGDSVHIQVIVRRIIVTHDQYFIIFLR